MTKRFSFIIKKLGSFLKRIFFPSPRTPLVCVAVGDSTVEGIGASSSDKAFCPLVVKSIRSHVGSCAFHNHGKSGARIADVMEEQLDHAVQQNPDIVIISIGGNDVIRLTPMKQFEKNFALLMNRFLTQTNARLVVNNIPDMSLAPVLPKISLPLVRLRVKRCNAIIAKYATDDRIVFVDLYTHSKLLKGFTQLVAEDGFHPSDMGYAVWASLIISKLMPLL